MELSRRADYGVRLILELAMLPAGTVLSTQEIAARQGLPTLFLAKIVAQLALAGLVRTQRGTGGGVILARPAEEINLRQVVEALDGPLALNYCLARPNECYRQPFCPVREVLAQAQADLVCRLEETDFASLAQRELELRAHLQVVTADPRI
ncbi:MAG TPA: Rrf2 family transcriptional regulator [Anaerolineae bacterium]|nr:Rrf2 family transcriptional regulator [Anaerolineae bacterium]